MFLPYPESLYLLSFLLVFGVLFVCRLVWITFDRLNVYYRELREV